MPLYLLAYVCILSFHQSNYMASAFIHYEQSEIHYLYYGNGSTNVIGLHGYGECASSFDILKACLPADYFLIAIDLPFHGSTLWNEQRPFTVEDLTLAIEYIFKNLNRQEQRFILIGYSMGGRIAMSLLQYIPEKISKLVLLAPDGMKTNFWYWLATQTQYGNRIFRFTMDKPGFFKMLLVTSNRFKLINKSIFKFTKAYMEDEQIRNQLYQRWTCMRTFKPTLKIVRTIIQEKQLPVRMLYGKHDRIILAKRAFDFGKGLESLCGLFVIDAGHNILQQKYAGVITKLMTT